MNIKRNKKLVAVISVFLTLSILTISYFAIFRGQYGKTDLDEDSLSEFCKLVEETNDIIKVSKGLNQSCVVEGETYTDFASLVEKFKGHGSALHLSFYNDDPDCELESCDILITSNFNKAYYPYPSFESVKDAGIMFDTIKKRYALLDPFYDKNFRDAFEDTYLGYFTPVIRDRLSFFHTTDEKRLYGIAATENYDIAFAAKSHTESFDGVAEIFYQLGEMLRK